jgi:hypothetical protein
VNETTCRLCDQALLTTADQHFGTHSSCYDKRQEEIRQQERVERAIRITNERLPFGCD